MAGRAKASVTGRPATPWAVTKEEVCESYSVDPATGLTDDQVAAHREKHGWNELDKEPGKSTLALILEQFEDTLVRILLGAALVSFGIVVHEEGFAGGVSAFVEPLVILLILFINAFVGVWQESNAEKALEALKELASATAKVMRNGTLISDLPARELVPGDIVHMAVGDRVPADMRVIEMRTATVRTEQAALTGESVAVNKETKPVRQADCEIQAKTCMMFSGTSVANGQCVCVVTAIGMKTEIGKIQEQIKEAEEEQDDSPLKQKLDLFGNQLARVIAVVCILVWLINYKHFLTITWSPDSMIPELGFDLKKCTYYFKIAVALAVAAIPEGLPAVITTCLALGTRKMAKRKAIVRRLPSVETLGCTTVICSDKTGTLTTNQMSVVHLIAMGNDQGSLQDLQVQGSSFNPGEGKVMIQQAGPNLTRIQEVCSLNNQSTLKCDESGTYTALGAPTEAALRVLVEKISGRKGGYELPEPGNKEIADNNRKLATLEFDRERKSMSTIVRPAHAQQNRLLVKGAPESVLARCTSVQLGDGRVEPMDERCRQAVNQAVLGMSKQALRCLALAYSDNLGHGLSDYNGSEHPAHSVLQDPSRYEEIESRLTLCGLVGLQDPPRMEVKDAIRLSKQAGIRVMMITGDNKDTAEAIAQKVGILEEGDSVDGRSLTGRDFIKLSEADQIAFLEDLPGGRVFSRAEPKTKQDIVRLLKAQGEICAMTGDGVNDAPALKLADIGVAMGIAGTEVAKEASDMVLADDNFSTIVAAVEEGRSIYANMKAFIRYMISSNIGEVASIFLVAALGLPEGMNPVQLLWVNLVTDGPPATALGFNPPDPHVMLKPPRRKDDNLITKWVLFRYLVIGFYVGAATVGAFVVWYTQNSFFGVDLTGDQHTTVSLSQLLGWSKCETGGTDTSLFTGNFTGGSFYAGGEFNQFEGCDYFAAGKIKASTLSLSVLVSIEMFNAFNALSEDGSLLSVPPWVNPYLIIAASISFGLHCLIMYVPFLAGIFSIVPLSANEWLLVILFSAPVILIDEVLKCFGRSMMRSELSQRLH
eukprot:TRINITY_DN1338_c0_g2_i1.p1 TRINITY_DN1338_c0_g2~~TRINITY_DN1338_c0_g2_i1.p1  ORF type:complete len:1048 (+),score=377.64 TRINITY_DN1338_c0_g2_i1:137-3280(+)